MQIIVRSIALLAMVLVSTASPACGLSFVDGVKVNLQAAIDRSTAIVAGHASSTQIEQSDTVIARLEIEAVFKGQAPRVLVFRARYLDQPCTDIEPPGTEPFIAFINFDSGNIQDLYKYQLSIACARCESTEAARVLRALPTTRPSS